MDGETVEPKPTSSSAVANQEDVREPEQPANQSVQGFFDELQ